MSQGERESRTGSSATRAPAAVPHHEVVGDAVRHVRDMGREISRALSPDGDVGLSMSARHKERDPRETQARKHANALRELYVHLGVYGIVIGFLFIIDVITGGNLWFYWPALAWGVAVAIHAVTVYGEGVFGKQWEDRKVREWLGQEPARAPAEAPEPTAGAGDMAGLVERGVGDVAALRRVALGVANPAARAQALRICATADNILAALAEEGRETRLAREFLERYLAPAQTILTQYARLSARGVAAAQPALERVEMHDLPLIERRMGALYERIHRGDVIDLQVASEMLELGLIEGGAATDESSS